MKKKLLSFALVLVMCLGLLPTAALAAGDFPDASHDQWYGDAVYHCVDKGYVSGFEDGTFHPNDPITYAQLASMLRGGVYADTSYAEETFPGKPWWYPGVYTCRQTGALEGVKADVVTGDSDVSKPVTRYEMALIVSNVMESQGLAVHGSVTTTVSEYIADWDSVPAEYQDAIANCYEFDIITGYPDGTFSGGETLTRAQVCVVLMRLDKAVADAQPVEPATKPQPSDEDEVLADVPTDLLGGGASSTTTSVSKTKVAYGTAKYPSLSNVDYSTYRKLDYKEKSDKYTYFYDFRDTWYAGCDNADAPVYPSFAGQRTKLYSDRQGFWGIRASTEEDVLTYEAYTCLDHVTINSVQFRTYDDAGTVVLDDTPNVEHIRKTGSLADGPYALCVWFDYTHKDGTVETIGTWQTLYVSDGHGWFADCAYSPDDATFKTWLAEEYDELAVDDVLQSWVANQGGDNLEKATDVTVIHYPFKSGTSRYPDETPKWRTLAHEICPDDDASDYAKAHALFGWMQSNLAYDMDMHLGNKVGKYRWAEAAASDTAKGFTMYDSHLGKCVDFSNVYAIMCRELGIPCHVMSNKVHAWNIVYLDGRWEIVDATSTSKAYVGTDNKAYAANVEAYWAKYRYKYVDWNGFCDTAYSKFKVGSYEAGEYANAVGKLVKTAKKLDDSLHDDAYYRKWSGTIYGH